MCYNTLCSYCGIAKEALKIDKDYQVFISVKKLNLRREIGEFIILKPRDCIVCIVCILQSSHMFLAPQDTGRGWGAPLTTAAMSCN